jgi:hypothetical protein
MTQSPSAGADRSLLTALQERTGSWTCTSGPPCAAGAGRSGLRRRVGRPGRRLTRPTRRTAGARTDAPVTPRWVRPAPAPAGAHQRSRRLLVQRSEEPTLRRSAGRFACRRHSWPAGVGQVCGRHHLGQRVVPESTASTASAWPATPYGGRASADVRAGSGLGVLEEVAEPVVPRSARRGTVAGPRGDRRVTPAGSGLHPAVGRHLSRGDVTRCSRHASSPRARSAGVTA